MSINIGEAPIPIQIPPIELERNPWAASGNPGKIDAAKIVNLVVDTITVSPTGYIKSGKTSFLDNTKAGYYISSEGVYLGSTSDATKFKYNIDDGTIDFVGTISSKSTDDIVAAFGTGTNAQKIITDLVNARIDTSSKNILSDFNFGSTNYAGAVKAGDITWNTTTGAITGGSGIAIYRNGIVGAKNGSATFTITTAGDATFAGTLSAAAGTLGTITAGTFNGVTITGGTIQTSSSANTGVKLTTSGANVYGETSFQIRDTSGNLRGYVGGNSNELYIIGASGREVKIGSYQNILLDAAAGASIMPVRANTDLGSSSSSNRWRSIYLNGLIYFSGTSANIQYSSSRIQNSSDTQVNGTLYCTGAGEFETARIKVGAYDFYPTTGAYDSSKYYLRS